MFLSSIWEILSSALTLNIYLTFIGLFQAVYSLVFAPKGKFLLVEKGNKFLRLLHLFVILSKTLLFLSKN